MSFMVFIAVCIANILFAVGVVCLPLPDEGPHLANGWGQPVRLRHLYAARQGLHLLISGDGTVHGSADQSRDSLMEIRPVDTGCIVIKGVAASQFLCMNGGGRLYSSHVYTDDCTFREQILPDGYNIYASSKHNTLVSLGSHRQRPQGRDRGITALSQFLPMISTLGQDAAQRPTDGLELMDQPEQSPTLTQYQDNVDPMDSFGKLSQILIHSPSFNKR